LILNLLIVVVALAIGGLLLWPRLANKPLWRATITPLASIIGSGFLVLGPILETSYGYLAPVMMAALCLGAWLFGSAIRANIRDINTEGHDRGVLAGQIETASSWVLAFAYVISVAYYLNLLGAFSVSLTPFDDQLHARLVASAVMLIILAVGWTKGFKALERLEQVSVGIKLAIIAGLLVGLAVFNARHIGSGEMHVVAPQITGWPAITLAFGLIVTIQGFETSRYLRAEYDAATRIRSMRLAQIISTAIYVVYIALIAYVFTPSELPFSETAVVDMMRIVAPILPILLVGAALSAQFSAAVADTGGSGGLMVELSGGRIPLRLAYAILVGAGFVLTWTSNIFEIIAYASRAFALYYALQAALAALAAWRTGAQPIKAAGFASLGLLGLAMTVFGTPVEG
tara:strand:+ start:51349 stop:52551 length:1203 start_codon:yes stop_codon:yes gene_type:complete